MSAYESGLTTNTTPGIRPEPAAPSTKRDRRGCYVGSPAYFLLNQACLIVAHAFDATPYLVGSSIERRDWRDVDVRVLLEDEQWERLFPGVGKEGLIWPPHLSPLWSLICSSTSLMLSQAGGLPVDFQIQRCDVANELYPGQRIALGIYPT